MYELFTLGGGVYLVDLLNAVAAITAGGAFVTLGQLAGVAGLAWVLFRTAFGGSWKDNAKWMLLFVAVWGAMIVPKATVRVVDRLDPTLAPAVVANVPIGLALFASLTSQVGDGLTRLTEQAFTLPNDLHYRRHGLIFGARLAARTTRLEITDAVFARNVRNYARQCVFHALLLGHISADDLRESTDIWSLVTATGSPSAGASPARMVEFATRQAATGTGATPIDRQIVTCRDAASRLNGQWTAEIQRAGTVFGRRIFPDARTEALARAELLTALPAAHAFLIGASRSAAEIMRQQMVLNAVHDAGEQWAAEAGNAAALRAYTEARAEAQTVSAYRAIGRQAETWVPLLRIVFECLYVG
ncbi:MAG: conjugal transfer protein TraG N-terminal domain-containing protein, partial [Rhodospirillaceae bacterium]|nr:conjugal transfer protein TraG N-terminal domain-containing protein [Rhodospirillaceae bacterium]